ncbi:hypothetical protein Trydic_g9736 [Trypoxylus dichotomus]
MVQTRENVLNAQTCLNNGKIRGQWKKRYWEDCFSVSLGTCTGAEKLMKNIKELLGSQLPGPHYIETLKLLKVALEVAAKYSNLVKIWAGPYLLVALFNPADVEAVMYIWKNRLSIDSSGHGLEIGCLPVLAIFGETKGKPLLQHSI